MGSIFLKEMHTDGYEPLFEKERQEGWQKVLGTLSSLEREVVIQKYFDQKKVAHIAKEMKLSSCRIYQLEHKALRRLGRKKILKLIGAFENCGKVAYLNRRSNKRIEEWEAQLRQESELQYQEYKKEVEEREKRRKELIALRIKEKQEERKGKGPLVTVSPIVENYKSLQEELNKPHEFPPPQVFLCALNPYSYPRLAINGGIIVRENDPETYHRWLHYLVKKEKEKEKCNISH